LIAQELNPKVASPNTAFHSKMYSNDSPTDISSLGTPTKIRTIDHIRRRPAMYLGQLDHHGISTLLDGVFSLFLNAAGSKPCNMMLCALDEAHFQIEVDSDCDWMHEIQQMDPFTFRPSPLSMLVLRAVSKHLEVHYNGRQYVFNAFAELQPWQAIPDRGRGWMRLELQLDPLVLDASQFSTAIFAERMRLLAMLYPHSKLHFEDGSQAVKPRAQFHFPQGLQHLYVESKAALGVETSCDLHFQGRWAGNWYQIAFGCTIHPLAQPSIRSFANTHETKGHGSLVDGVLEGIQKAIQFKTQEAQIPWRKNQRSMDAPQVPTLPMAKIGRARIRKHLVLVAAIDGDGLEFHHPTRDKLHSKAAVHAAREIAYHLVMEEFERNPAILPVLLDRLTQIGQ
jgi:DNA gyrase subunit B